MNARSITDVKERLIHRVHRFTRLLDTRRRAHVFSRGDDVDALRRIYVINLDRKHDRWRRQRRELDRFRDRLGERLSTITRRFSAVDARHFDDMPDSSVLVPTFTLADQLAIHPNPLLEINDETRAREITMTRQEIAVALSHLEVWKLIANGDTPSALVLEDDVFMSPGFARGLDSSWSALTQPNGVYGFDLLYLAYHDVGSTKPVRSSGPHRRLTPGIWEASGYVLTREGAQKLLDELPIRGPVDLWLNMQFGKLQVYTTPRPLIEQRIDEPSNNSYSVLPVLSQVGAVTREKPLLPTTQRLMCPVIALGAAGSGLTALAKALSMLGYTCLSDLDTLPVDELDRLRTRRWTRTFNAYVNIGSLDEDTIRTIMQANRRALLITTSPGDGVLGIVSKRHLEFGPDVKDKWAKVCDFLELDYPSFPYPVEEDAGQRTSLFEPQVDALNTAINLRFDTSPWIVRNPSHHWHGVAVDAVNLHVTGLKTVRWDNKDPLDRGAWKLRDDTFPSNLALFTPERFTEVPGGLARLALHEQATPVREYTSAAIASRESYLYGSFGAELQPSNVRGLITGLFLHRNGPRQEIDIEFRGKNTTKMLVNVYYNPGPEGTKLEYGYRGTPTEIELGFDAAADLHLYEIDWQPSGIQWKVDGMVVYQRLVWNPTPIPDQPLEFNINLWHSRSAEFAGHLDQGRLPATTKVRSIEINTSNACLVGSGPTALSQIKHDNYP